MKTQLKSADKLYETANGVYKTIILDAVRKAGSVANLAAILNLPAPRFHKVLSRDGIKARRKLAHEIAAHVGRVGE